MYPTPYQKVKLGCINQMIDEFPNSIIGLSDHSLGNYTCFAAIALGARILESISHQIKLAWRMFQYQLIHLN